MPACVSVGARHWSYVSLLLSTALVAATVTLPSCSWDRPGVDPYMGSIEAAVDRYRDIPPPVRARLKEKMRARAYDDIASITRDKIQGKRSYSNLRDMHFGNGRVCRQVGRTKWKPDAIERGLVYCEGEHCLIIPTVCRNVSRVTPSSEIDIETAVGREVDPPSPSATAESSLLGGQAALEDPTRLPLAMREPEPAPTPAPLGGDGTPTFAPFSMGGGGPPPDSLRGPLGDPYTGAPLPVPEPSTWALMALGLAVVARKARRRKQPD